MSASFWNIRRRLRAQQRQEEINVNIAAAQTAEKQEAVEEKPKKKAGAKNDSGRSKKS